MLLSKPGPCPRQPLAQHDAGNAKHARGLLRRQPRQVNQLNRRPLQRGKSLAALDQCRTGALRVDPARQLLDLIDVQCAVPGEAGDGFTSWTSVAGHITYSDQAQALNFIDLTTLPSAAIATMVLCS